LHLLDFDLFTDTGNERQQAIWRFEMRDEIQPEVSLGNILQTLITDRHSFSIFGQVCGHKINLSSEGRGFITALSIEDGNPGDKTLFLPVLDYHQSVLGRLSRSVLADGGYASQANVAAGRAMGLKHVVFHKPVGVSLTAMGVKSKTFNALRDFRPASKAISRS
jgi:hypothetical protein